MISYQNEDQVLQRWQGSGSRFGIPLPEAQQPCLHQYRLCLFILPSDTSRRFQRSLTL